MPLEINEIAIRMRVAEGDERRAERGKADADEGCTDVARQEIVDDCVRKVLKALQALERR